MVPIVVPALVRASTVAPCVTSSMTPTMAARRDRKSTRLNSSHGYISYAVFCLKKKKSLVVDVHGLVARDHRRHGHPAQPALAERVQPVAGQGRGHQLAVRHRPQPATLTGSEES